jgi:hypothetical protein
MPERRGDDPMRRRPQAARPGRSGQPAYPDRSAQDSRPRRAHATRRVDSEISSRERRRRITVAVALLALLLSCIASIPFSGIAAGAVYSANAQAHDAVQRLTDAETELKALGSNPLSIPTILRTKQDFAAANADFRALQQETGFVPGILSALPVVGGKVGSAKHLIPLATEASQAGIYACDALSILATKLGNPLSKSGSRLQATDMAALSADASKVQALYAQIAPQLAGLTPSDLSLAPQLASKVAPLQAELPKISNIVQDLQGVVAALPIILGTSQPGNFLVEVLDSTEIRPGGGFLGNYGLLTLAGGHLQGLSVQDITLVWQNGNPNLPYPAQDSWVSSRLNVHELLQDCNLEGDFPASSRLCESLYRAWGGKAALQGVIAITPWWFQQALKFTGNIYLPDYHLTITPENFINTIHYYNLVVGTPGQNNGQVDPTTGTTYQKRFTGVLFKAFFERMSAVAGKNIGALSHLMLDSLHTKDIQVYFNDAHLEHLLNLAHLDSSIQAPAQGDSLMVVDANITPNKANAFMTYTIADSVAIGTDGSATHTTRIQYKWPNNPTNVQNTYGLPTSYLDYVRVYVPTGSVLTKQSGWSSLTTTPTQFGRAVWGGYLTFDVGATGTITLIWKVPHAAYQDGSGWHYTVLQQRQAGLVRQLTWQATLPACAHVSATTGGVRMTGNQTASVSVPLTQDATLGLDYSC